jgi:hypothetical protein
MTICPALATRSGWFWFIAALHAALCAMFFALAATKDWFIAALGTALCAMFPASATSMDCFITALGGASLQAMCLNHMYPFLEFHRT